MKIFFWFFCFFSFTLSAEEVRYINTSTADGGVVYGDFYPAGERAVVLAHGAIFNRKSWAGLIESLLENNISVLAIDFRGYGESSPGSGGKENDVLAAMEFLKQQKGISKVSLLGASMGGRAVALAAIKAPPGSIDKIILLSPAPIADTAKLTGNILYIASRHEPMLGMIQQQFEKTPEPKKMVLLEGSAHAQHILKTGQKQTLIETIINFLKQ